MPWPSSLVAVASLLATVAAKEATHLGERVDEVIGGAAGADANDRLAIKPRQDSFERRPRAVALQAFLGRQLGHRRLAAGFGRLHVARVLFLEGELGRIADAVDVELAV